MTLPRKQDWFSGSPPQIVAFNQLLTTVSNIANAGPLSGASDKVNAALSEYNKNFK